MTRNMGAIDRTVRIVIAAVLAFLAATGRIDGGLAIAAWVVAAVFLLTSLVGFCPAYRLVGIDTCGR